VQQESSIDILQVKSLSSVLKCVFKISRMGNEDA